MGIHTTITRSDARSKRDVVFSQHFAHIDETQLTVSPIVPHAANKMDSPVNPLEWPS